MSGYPLMTVSAQANSTVKCGPTWNRVRGLTRFHLVLVPIRACRTHLHAGPAESLVHNIQWANLVCRTHQQTLQPSPGS